MSPMNLALPLRTAARFALVASTALAAALLPAPPARAQANYATPYTFNTFAGAPFFPTGADGTGPAAEFLSLRAGRWTRPATCISRTRGTIPSE